MATIDYKEKYEQALEVAQRFYNNSVAITKKGLEDIFPELAESEDEKIRKEIILFLREGRPYYCPNSAKRQEWSNWLEKQGKKGANGNERKFPISEPKPAWSEEDDTVLNEIIASVNGFDATSGTTTMNFGKHEAKINWLKTIKYKELAQLSDEWSEEDETSLSDIIKCLEEHKHCMLTEEHDIRINLGINFLKSLKYRVQPQSKQEWSEEDKNYYDTIIAILENTKDDAQLSDSQISFLKSIRPKSQWKPSEGQLECLGYAIEKAEKDWSPLTNNRIYLTLKALKKQLKKLREE